MGAKIVIDTNVLISALGFGGFLRTFLARVLERDEWFISQCQLDELTRVLTYPKFSFLPSQQERILAFVRSHAVLVHPKTTQFIIQEDPADNRILDIAAECRADFIITGDTHLLKLGSFQKTRIVTPAQFLCLA
ncbi:putative toxin-antitoxin system toxin component, PIN family [Candidatus Woesearchaeota archaeon]|nr:putative toxin-antitoxin system toxin component, PIN family [Candidatus Woesearchaeota archaeon]